MSFKNIPSEEFLPHQPSSKSFRLIDLILFSLELSPDPLFVFLHTKYQASSSVDTFPLYPWFLRCFLIYQKPFYWFEQILAGITNETTGRVKLNTATQKENLLSSNVNHFFISGATKQQRRSCVQWAYLIKSTISGDTSSVFVVHSGLLSISHFFWKKKSMIWRIALSEKQWPNIKASHWTRAAASGSQIINWAAKSRMKSDY